MDSRKLGLGRFGVGDTGAEAEARGSSVAEVCWKILRGLGNLWLRWAVTIWGKGDGNEAKSERWCLGRVRAGKPWYLPGLGCFGDGSRAQS